MRPEEALEHARAEARRRGYVEPEGELELEPIDQVSRAQLLEWALVEPDLTKLRSTRRFGAPITWLKRMMLRGLQQYHNELTSQQTRFNIHLLRKVLEIEEGVEGVQRKALEIEQRLERLEKQG